MPVNFLDPISKTYLFLVYNQSKKSFYNLTFTPLETIWHLSIDLWPWCGFKQIKIWNKDHHTLTPLTKKEITLRMGDYASGIFKWNFSSGRAAPLHFSSLRRSACTNSHTAAFTVTEKAPPARPPYIYIIQAAFFFIPERSQVHIRLSIRDSIYHPDGHITISAHR